MAKQCGTEGCGGDQEFRVRFSDGMSANFCEDCAGGFVFQAKSLEPNLKITDLQDKTVYRYENFKQVEGPNFFDAHPDFFEV